MNSDVASTTGPHHTHTLVAHDRLMSHPSSIRLQSVVWRHQEEQTVAFCAVFVAATAVSVNVSCSFRHYSIC